MDDSHNPVSSKKRILVVEDDQLLRDLYVDILRQEGFDVDQAVDGQEGYTAMHKGGYDLVLLDIIMPHMDGLTVLSKLVKETPPIKPNKAVVILSNLGQDSAIAQAVSLGARSYLIKSDLTPDQVVAEVKRYLNEVN